MQHPLNDEMDTYDANPIQEGLKISDTGMQKNGQNGGDLLKLLMMLLGNAENGGQAPQNEGEPINAA